MRLVQPVPAAISAAMTRIQSEYAELVKMTPPFSLLSLFNSEDFHFEAYCRDFVPHPRLNELKASTTGFGRQYGILLPDADAYITCAMFLFPAAPIEKIVCLSKNYALDFYLNDKLGRDARTPPDEMKQLYMIRDGLVALGESLELGAEASFAEIASVEVLQEIASNSPASWFRFFLHQYLDHIYVAHKSSDSASLGYIQSIEEYIDMRVDISGMPHTVTAIEYANGVFLDWDLLDEAGIEDDLRKANAAVSFVGALTNDLFSFEKEVIDQQSESNVIFNILVNNFRMKLQDAIGVAGNIIKDLLTDYQDTIQRLDTNIRHSPVLPDSAKAQVYDYLQGLKSVLQACWTWQTYTQRYKRTHSIWQETAVSAVSLAE